jgi:hypothetical protein
MAGLMSLARALAQQVNTRRTEAAIYEYDDSGNLASGKSGHPEGFRFQYFPSTITVNKSQDYAVKKPFGASLPVRQWVGGGDNPIGFTAEFSCDVDLMAKGAAAGAALMKKLHAAGAEDFNPDIRSALAWLGNMQSPTYGPEAINTKPPPALLLVLPGSGIGLVNGDPGGAVATDSAPCVLDSMDVTYEAFFPSGLPRLVQVALSFQRIPQIGGSIVFPGRTSVSRGAAHGAPFLGYPLHPRRTL